MFILADIFFGLPGGRAPDGFDYLAAEPEVSAHELQSDQFRLPDRLSKRTLGTDTTVKVQHQVAETLLVQAFSHSVDRRPLLGHKQHSLVAGNQGANQVRDGLALTGTRRAVNDEVLAG